MLTWHPQQKSWFFKGVHPLIALVSILLFTTNLHGQLLAQETPIPFLQTLKSHKPIYVLNSSFLNGGRAAQGYSENEVKIQFSFKKVLFDDFYFGYSHKAFWQLYDMENSRSFRENNYNPEFFFDFGNVWIFDLLRLGIWEHESNGEKVHYSENGELINDSRTWNRSYLFFQSEFTTYAIKPGLKIWSINDQEDSDYGSFYDDNPDIAKYMGHAELYLEFGSAPAFISLMVRRGWGKGTETVLIEGRLPFHYLFGGEDNGVDLMVQFFSGYGESLLDYNRKLRKAGIGFSVR